jgi:ComF family protein
MYLIEHIISLIAPHNCLSCRAEGRLVCDACLHHLEPACERCFACLKPSPAGRTCSRCAASQRLTSVRSAVTYNNVVKDIVHCLKFERSRAAVLPMAASIRQHIAIDQTDSIATHVPAAPPRIRLRGYDQAQLLVRHLCKGQILHTPLLARTQNTRQVGSSGQQRRIQQNAAFRPINQRYIKNRNILLFDDVITTGSTLEACARVLLEAGATRVDAITFAQA